MSTKIFALLALATLTLARPSPTRTTPLKRQDAALPVNPFTCLNSNKLVGACCVTNENPDYTNFYCAAPTGTAVADVAGAYVCPTKENDRAVSSWCCSALNHGGPDDGYTLWCEDGVSGQLLDTTSLSLTSVESALASPSLDATAVEDAVAEIQAEILAVEDELNLDTSALDVSAVDSALAELESALAVDPSTLDISAVEKLVDEVENALAGSSLDTSAVQSALAEVESALASA